MSAEEGRGPQLTTTGYAVLGLLAIGDWSAYELSGLMARSVGLILPRASSVVYEEPKRLVAKELATSRGEARGRRSVAIYSITPKGRSVLGAWLAMPSAPPQLDAEAVVKAVFAENGSLEALRRTVEQLRVESEEQLDAIIAQAASYLDGGGPFPDRLPLIALSGRFPYLYLSFLAEWATWAKAELEEWPADQDGHVDLEPLRERAVEIFREVVAEGKRQKRRRRALERHRRPQ